ncbi:hypothetical protein N7463_003480 [Penicillium fimorum]|uniref:Uncharacterized protein n=1 Tax=Penicillium fimorum TaxID=1882269 RepID=A0A9W9Y1D5_9EURO|nr:hypothetical protein N7463_003480 [Penicillium fimorum]
MLTLGLEQNNIISNAQRWDIVREIRRQHKHKTNNANNRKRDWLWQQQQSLDENFTRMYKRQAGRMGFKHGINEWLIRLQRMQARNAAVTGEPVY